MNINGRVNEVRQHGMKTEFRQHPENGRIMWRPSIKSIIAIITLSSLLIGGIVRATVFYYQHQDTVVVVDSLKTEQDIIYAVQDSMKEMMYHREKAQMRLLKVIVRAVSPNKQEADTLIKDVEEEIEKDRKHTEERLEEKIKRIKERVKKK